MPNASLIESPWSAVASLTTGFVNVLRPRKTKKCNFVVDIGKSSDFKIFLIDGVLHTIFRNGNDCYSIARYDLLTNKWTIINTSNISFDYAYNVVGGDGEIFLLIKTDILKLYILNIAENTWTEKSTNSEVCIFSPDLISMTYIKKDNIRSVYVFGASEDPAVPTNYPTFLKYTVDTNNWTQQSFTDKVIGTTCPGQILFPVMSGDGNGFYTSEGINNSSFWYYDYDTNIWSKETNILLTDSNGRCNYLLDIGEYLILIETATNSLNKEIFYFHQYSKIEKRWQIIEDVPSLFEFKYPAFGVIGSDIYLLTFLYSTIYKPVISDMCTTIRCIPSPDQPPSGKLLHIEDNLRYYLTEYVAVPGSDNMRSLNGFNLIIYNTLTKSSTIKSLFFPEMRLPTSQTCIVYHEGKIYFYGGYRDKIDDIAEMVGNLYVYTISDPEALGNPTLTLLYTPSDIATDTDKCIQGSTGIVIGDKLYIFGGYRNADMYNYVKYFDLTLKTWTIKSCSTPEMKRSNIKLYVLEDNIFLLKGASADISGIILATCWKYSISQEIYISIAEPPIAPADYRSYFIHDEKLKCTSLEPIQSGVADYLFYVYDNVLNTWSLDKTITKSALPYVRFIFNDAFYVNNNKILGFGQTYDTDTLNEYNGYTEVLFDFDTISYTVPIHGINKQILQITANLLKANIILDMAKVKPEFEIMFSDENHNNVKIEVNIITDTIDNSTSHLSYASGALPAPYNNPDNPITAGSLTVKIRFFSAETDYSNWSDLAIETYNTTLP